jgi:Cu(I)/Ag(I) efflux system membrane protein CusA/SilA
LTKAPGVAEVASIGGFVQQYQVVVDPVKLRAYGMSADESRAGDPRLEPRRRRPRGRDGRDRVHGARPRLPARRGRHRRPGGQSERGTPVLVRDIARVELGPDERRGITELNGEGEVVSGIAMARYGQNALDVIHNVKEKIAEIAPGLPAGVTIETVYDRSELINAPSPR